MAFIYEKEYTMTGKYYTNLYVTYYNPPFQVKILKELGDS